MAPDHPTVSCRFGNMLTQVAILDGFYKWCDYRRKFTYIIIIPVNTQEIEITTYDQMTFLALSYFLDNFINRFCSTDGVYFFLIRAPIDTSTQKSIVTFQFDFYPNMILVFYIQSNFLAFP